MKRRIIILLTISLLILAMAGCEKKETSEESFSGWEIRCMTNDNQAVANVKMQVCSNTMCSVIESDENGIAKFNGNAKSYELHLDSIPDNYILSSEFPDELSDQEKSITILFDKK